MHDLKKSRWILKKEKAFQGEAYEIFLFFYGGYCYPIRLHVR